MATCPELACTLETFLVKQRKAVPDIRFLRLGNVSSVLSKKGAKLSQSPPRSLRLQVYHVILGTLKRTVSPVIIAFGFVIVIEFMTTFNTLN
jgi:hypothetical protein